MLALSEGCLTNRKMILGGGYNVNGIYLINQLVEIFKAPDAILFNDLIGNIVIGIMKSMQDYSLYLFPIADVEFSEVTCSDYAYLEHVANLVLPIIS
jgi:hypothetical protein